MDSVLAAPLGSRINLIGENPDPAVVEHLSLEKQVTPQTFSSTQMKMQPSAENSVIFYLALRKAGVPAEMHIYKPGRHGLNLAQFDPVVDTWPELLKRWMRGL